MCHYNHYHHVKTPYYWNCNKHIVFILEPSTQQKREWVDGHYGDDKTVARAVHYCSRSGLLDPVKWNGLKLLLPVSLKVWTIVQSVWKNTGIDARQTYSALGFRVPIRSPFRALCTMSVAWNIAHLQGGKQLNIRLILTCKIGKAATVIF